MSAVVGVIFAGGVGLRMRQSQTPKQFLEVNDQPIIVHTLKQFESHPQVDAVVVACVEDWISHLNALVNIHHLEKVTTVIPGGVTGQDSIYNALLTTRGLYGDDATVLIHDAVRPVITPRLLSALIESVATKGNGISCTPCYETIIITKNPGVVEKVPPRSEAFSAQAPQAFILRDIIDVHERIRRTNPRYEGMVDACTMLHALGVPAYMVRGNFGNIKVTNPEDVYLLRALLQVREQEDLLGVSMLDPN